MSFGKVTYSSFTSKRKYGVELEVTSRISKENIEAFIRKADANHQTRVSQNYAQDYNNNFWHVKFDRSCGFEVASYVATGLKDLENIQNVSSFLHENGVRANHHCSVHVHAEVRDFRPSRLASLVACWMRMEKVIAEMVPEERITGEYSKYARLLTRHFEKKYQPGKTTLEPKSFFKMIMPKPFSGHYSGWRPEDRRLAINITNYAKAHYESEYYAHAPNRYRKTVELRLPEGTLCPRNVGNWVKFFLQFISMSKKAEFPEDTTPMGIVDALRFMGLHAPDGELLVLSRGLYSLKVWLLERIVRFGRDEGMRDEAVKLLNFVSEPHKTFAKKAREVKPTKVAVPDRPADQPDGPRRRAGVVEVGPAPANYWQDWE